MDIVTADVNEFLQQLHLHFEHSRRQLLRVRREKALALQNGRTLEFRPETLDVRHSEWMTSPPPADLQDRRVEITGPAEPKMIINGLNSGANVFMADFEDALSPTWANVVAGHRAIRLAVRRELTVEGEGKVYTLKDKLATLVVRPRGLHLTEDHVRVHGEVISASLFDFGVHFFNNAQTLLKSGSGPYFYLPKLESAEEAAWWREVFRFSEEALGLPRGTIRATVLIETLTAAFEMEEILFALKDHIVALNAGRWDYIFSLIKKFRHDRSKILPDRSQVTMTTGFMRAYCELLVRTCHRRGAHAIGGMSAFIPNRKQPEVTAKALEQVRADKRREAGMGFDGTWVAHPDLVAIAREEFDAVLGANPHQKSRIPEASPCAADLLRTEIPGATVTEAGVRANLNVGLLYLDKWLSGTGAAALHNLMEDAATAEISRSQLWQWLHHRVPTQDGRVIDEARLERILEEESLKVADVCAHRSEAEALLRELVFSRDFPEFLTLKAYPTLNRIHDQGGLHATDRRSASESLANRAPLEGDQARLRG